MEKIKKPTVQHSGRQDEADADHQARYLNNERRNHPACKG